MPIELPAPIAAFFKAMNAQDIDAMLAPFADDASVKDEGEEHRGRDAIRAWMEEVKRKYGVTVEPKDMTYEPGRVVVDGLVSGNFPGSPLVLSHTFTLAGSHITRLEIE
jgi:uncharacterized protein (TIGR02246 family)